MRNASLICNPSSWNTMAINPNCHYQKSLRRVTKRWGNQFAALCICLNNSLPAFFWVVILPRTFNFVRNQNCTELFNCCSTNVVSRWKPYSFIAEGFPVFFSHTNSFLLSISASIFLDGFTLKPALETVCVSSLHRMSQYLYVHIR